MDNRDTFLLEEYKALRAEILQQLNHVRKIEVSVAIAVGAVIAWLATHPVLRGNAMYCLTFLPVMGGVASLSFGKYFAIVSEYLRQTESYFLEKGEGGPAGWQHFIEHRHWFMKVIVIYWIMLIAFTPVVLALLNCSCACSCK